MPERDSSSELKPGPTKWYYTALAFIVWLFTAGLGLVEIYLARQTLVRIWGRFSDNIYAATVAGHVLVVILALVWIAYVIMGGEVGLRKVGRQGGWSIFAWAFAIEMLILILYFIV